MIGLRDSELHLVLELLPDCSQLTVVSSSGPIRFERLSAIRDFPDPELNDEQQKQAVEAGLSAEELTLKDDRYLPVSELDLRSVVRDLKAVISGLKARDASTVVRGLTLSGINSAHPLIKDLFQEALGCDVKLLNPVLMSRVTGFSPDDLLVQAGLARLIGLGLGFLPREQLLVCNLTEVSSHVASSASPALAFEVSIDAEAQPITSDVAPLDVDVSPLFSDGQSDTALDESLSQEEALKVDKEEKVDEPEVAEVEEVWPSLGLDVEVKEEDLGVDKEEKVDEPEVAEVEEVWPSLGLDVEVKEEDLGVDKEEKVDEPEVAEVEEVWPSLGLDVEVKEEDLGVDKEEKVDEPEVAEGKEDWPSIKSIPGLDLSQSLPSSVSSKPKSSSSPVIEDASESSSLGELRFQDE